MTKLSTELAAKLATLRLLHQSWTDICFKYQGLTEIERSLISAEEFNSVLEMMRDYGLPTVQNLQTGELEPDPAARPCISLAELELVDGPSAARVKEAVAEDGDFHGSELSEIQRDPRDGRYSVVLTTTLWGEPAGGALDIF